MVLVGDAARRSACVKPGRESAAPNGAFHAGSLSIVSPRSQRGVCRTSVDAIDVNAMHWYEGEVRELVARLAAHRVADPIVCYGSSSLRLWATIAHDLENERIVNAAFGGSTLEACAYFFERIVPPLEPAALLVYAGDNDLGDGRSVDDVLASFRKLAVAVDRLCGPIPFGFLSIKPSPARSGLLDRIRAANERIRTEIEQRPNGFYVPLFDAMLRAGAPRPELFVDDGLHLAPAGYALWARILQPVARSLSGAPPPAPPARMTPPDTECDDEAAVP